MKPQGTGHQNHEQVVRGDLDFYISLVEDHEEFRQKELSVYADYESRFREALMRNFIELERTEITDQFNKHRYYETTERLHDIVEQERDNEMDTICPCSCHRSGFKNRSDGYHCPNPDCDEGPWEEEDLSL